jgi:hypothetical protein
VINSVDRLYICLGFNEKIDFIPCVCAIHFSLCAFSRWSDFRFVLLCPGLAPPERYGLPIPTGLRSRSGASDKAVPSSDCFLLEQRYLFFLCPSCKQFKI